mgnify:CR=1 FL=1
MEAWVFNSIEGSEQTNDTLRPSRDTIKTSAHPQDKQYDNEHENDHTKPATAQFGAYAVKKGSNTRKNLVQINLWLGPLLLEGAKKRDSLQWLFPCYE